MFNLQCSMLICGCKISMFPAIQQYLKIMKSP